MDKIASTIFASSSALFKTVRPTQLVGKKLPLYFCMLTTTQRKTFHRERYNVRWFAPQEWEKMQLTPIPHPPIQMIYLKVMIITSA